METIKTKGEERNHKIDVNLTNTTVVFHIQSRIICNSISRKSMTLASKASKATSVKS
jgi:hypothetical protein